MEYFILAGLVLVTASHFFLQDKVKRLEERIEQLERIVFPEGIED